MLAHHGSAMRPWDQLPHEASGFMDPTALAHLAAAAALDQQHQHDAAALQSMLAQTATHGGAGALDLSQLLAQLPSTPPGLGMSPSASSPQQQLHHLHHASSTGSLQFDAQTADAWMLQASGASSPTTALPLEQLHASGSSSGPRVFVPDSLKQTVAGSSPPTSQHQLLLQAALGQQQQQPAMPDAVNMLQEQLLLQALQQQQQQQASQPNLQATLLAALSAGAPTTPPGLAQQPLAGANMWPYMSPPGLAANSTAATAAAATAAALLAAQQQQQQAALTQALASTGLAPGADTTTALLQQLLLGQQGLAGMAGAPAAGMLNQLQPWAVEALATQMQQQGAALNAAALNQLASLLDTGAAAGNTGNRATGVQGRRRSGRRSSGTAAAGGDLAGSFSGFGAASRANSIAGSDMADMRGSSTSLPAVLPAGVLASDLCPTKYEDNWGGSSTDAPAAAAEGAAAATTSVTSDDSYQLARNSSSASTSSIESSAGASACGSALSLSSSGGGEAAGPDADGKWQWDSHFCTLEDDDAASQGSSGVAGRACRKAAAAAAAAAKQQAASAAGDDTQVSKDQAPGAAAGSHKAKVWIPGQREAAGDDSWYLPRPPTCRLFVGNIGCWVDEAMLLAYFGKYGHVVDVQVMWNTKMLARGRRVNREFAFISYSSPLEAARAVHWLDGCRLPDMEKDKNGVTVEYENGEGDSPAPK